MANNATSTPTSAGAAAGPTGTGGNTAAASPSAQSAQSAPSSTKTASATGETPSQARGAGPGPGEELLARVVQGAHETVDRFAEVAAPRVQRLQQGYESAGEVLHARADGVREAGDQWTESLRCTVREHPLASLAAALAVGVIVARLTS